MEQSLQRREPKFVLEAVYLDSRYHDVILACFQSAVWLCTRAEINPERRSTPPFNVSLQVQELEREHG